MVDVFDTPTIEFVLSLNNNNNTQDENSTEFGYNSTTELPSSSIPSEFTQMGPNSLNCIIVYTFLFFIAATGNFSVFFSVLQQLRRNKSSRIAVLILHLSIADLLVTFGVIPLEIIWRITVAWYGGNFLCKVCKFFSAFGLYLSSMVLICISLDRYFAIIHPLRVTDAKRRGRLMLASAWISAIICSAPQSIIFHVQEHPLYPSFRQCVTIGFFTSAEEEMVYNILSVIFMYFLPLAIIFFTYGMILCKISRKSRQQKESRKDLTEASGRILLRRNENLNHMERAKSRTLRLTFVIVLVFLICWTPYVVITLWYMVDRESAAQVDGKVQDFLFIMAVANSCVNPLIYGTYTRECRESMTNCCGLTQSGRNRHHEPDGREAYLQRVASRKSTASFRFGSTTAPPPTPPAQSQHNQGGNYFSKQSSFNDKNHRANNQHHRSVKLQVPENSPGDPKLTVEFSTYPISRISEEDSSNADQQLPLKTNVVTNIPLTHYNNCVQKRKQQPTNNHLTTSLSPVPAPSNCH